MKKFSQMAQFHSTKILSIFLYLFCFMISLLEVSIRSFQEFMMMIFNTSQVAYEGRMSTLVLNFNKFQSLPVHKLFSLIISLNHLIAHSITL